MKYNFMQGVINSGETQIKEIKVYLDGESKMTDTSENFKKDIFFPSFKEPLDMGQEIRIDIILNDGTICKDKEVLIVSEDKIMAPIPKCDSNQKKEDWCVDDQVWGTKCKDGEWIKFIDVDCSYWEGTCKNGKCVEAGNEDNILILTELDKSSEKIEELKAGSMEELNIGAEEESTISPNEETTELIQNQLEENSSINPVKIILSWFVNLFR